MKPADLKGDASALWDSLIRLLAGVIQELDGVMLAELCWHGAELQRIKRALAKKKPGEPGYNQLLVAAGICTDKFTRIGSRFGLTPNDRAKLGVSACGSVVAKTSVKSKSPV